MNIRELEKTGSRLTLLYDTGDQLKKFVYDCADGMFLKGDAARDAIGSIEELEKHRRFMAKKFIESLGGLPSGDTPLHARTVDRIQRDGYSIEKVIFESRPQVYVTANLYLPDGIASPTGAVLFLCGHHQQAKHEPEYQTVCQYLVLAGLVVLAQDPIGQGERMSYYEKSIGATTVEWGVCEHDYAGCQCWALGDAPARYFVHDAMRGIDYLCSRTEVDPSRIGVTGNSGGGTQTCLMMMCDPRVAAAAPATFVMNRKIFMDTGAAQDSEQIWPGMTALGFDHEDILMAMTPKPVLVLAVTADFFPIEGTRRTVERVRRYWEMYDHGCSLELFVDHSDHHYTRAMAKKAAEFFSLHLKGTAVKPDGALVVPVEPSLLWCTRTGQVRGDMEIVRGIYEENLIRLDELENRRSALPEAEYRENGLKWLQDKVFHNRKPCDVNLRYFPAVQVNDFKVNRCFWWSQEGLLNHGLLFRDYRFAEKSLPLTIAVWDGGTRQLQPNVRWIRKTCESGRAVLVLDVSGVGAVRPNIINYAPELDSLGTFFKLAHELMWMGDSLPALRTYDVIRALDMTAWLPEADRSDIRIHAGGMYGLYGRLAAVLDERIKKVEVRDGLESCAAWIRSRHYDDYDIMSVVLPGVLNYLDMPDIDRWTKEMGKSEL